MNFEAEALEVLKNLQSFLDFILAFVCVSKGKVGVDIFRVFVNAELERMDSLFILGPDVKKDTRVIQDDAVRWVQFDGLSIVVQSFVEAALSLHVDTHVLEDA